MMMMTTSMRNPPQLNHTGIPIGKRRFVITLYTNFVAHRCRRLLMMLNRKDRRLVDLLVRKRKRFRVWSKFMYFYGG